MREYKHERGLQRVTRKERRKEDDERPEVFKLKSPSDVHVQQDEKIREKNRLILSRAILFGYNPCATRMPNKQSPFFSKSFV